MDPGLSRVRSVEYVKVRMMFFFSPNGIKIFPGRLVYPPPSGELEGDEDLIK